MSSDTINYNKKEEQFCPRCNEATDHLVTDEAFEGTTGFICTKCGLVWHWNNMGGACAHGEVPRYAIKMAQRKLTTAEKKARAESEKKLIEFLGPEVMQCIEHETKNWDLYWRLER